MNTSLLPSSLGFHCDGECWSIAGKAEGLVAWLEARDLRLRDWFVQADWAQESPLHHNLPSMETVHPIQDYINREALESYAAGLTTSLKKPYEQYPVLFTWLDKTFIFQGTHRLAALYDSGATSFEGYVLSLTPAM